MQEYPLTASPQRITSAAAPVIHSLGWRTTIDDALDLASQWEARLTEYLRNTLNEHSELGRPTRLCFNSSANDHIQGSCYCEPTDPAETRTFKGRRALTQAYVDAIARLEPHAFENLCAKTLTLLGVTSPKTTRQSGDQGIDFYGAVDAQSMFYPKDLYPTIQKQLTLWVVGQAKHYLELQSGTAEIRELVGSLELARAKAFGSCTPDLDALNLRLVDPIFLIFISSGYISRNAWHLLKNSGVLAMDGDMLAAFLADRGIAIDAGNFSSTRFEAWIN